MFKVGDSVRILKCNPSRYIGTIGTVTKTDTSYNGVLVEAFDGQKLVFYDPSNLELINKNPVQTVTKREIVPGVYGRLSIEPPTNDQEKNKVLLRFADKWGEVYKSDTGHYLGISELKSIIDTLQQIISVLEENE